MSKKLKYLLLSLSFLCIAITGLSLHFAMLENVNAADETTILTCVLKFDANGGQGSVPNSITYKRTSTTAGWSGNYQISDSRPNKEGCKFMGWAISENATVAQYANGHYYGGAGFASLATPNADDTTTGTLTLYAVYGQMSISVSQPEGSGTSTSPYLISSAEQLRWIAYNTNKTSTWSNGKYFKQTANIDIQWTLWEPIGLNNNYSFKGFYDGGGFTIANLRVDNYSLSDSISATDGGAIAPYQGLFGYVGTAGTIQNVNVSVGTVSGEDNSFTIGYQVNSINNYVTATNTFYVGAIAGRNDGTISNCKNYAFLGYGYNDQSTGKGNTIGGIVGDNRGTIENCTNSGYVMGATNVGGNAGMNYGTISNCENKPGPSSTYKVYTHTDNDIGAKGSYAGGIAGTNYGKVENCKNFAYIKLFAGSSTVGGIVGVNYQNSSILSSVNFGKVEGVYSGVGGIVGQIANNTSAARQNLVTNCINQGQVISTSSSSSQSCGGIVGNVVISSSGAFDVEISSCENQASIDSYYDVGGIAGRIGSSSSDQTGLTVKVANCTNAGYVKGATSTSATGYYIGGIVGRINSSNSVIVDCVNSAQVSNSTRPNYYVGGIAGMNQLATIEGCVNSGKFLAYKEGGGIVGYASNGNILNCNNHGIGSLYGYSTASSSSTLSSAENNVYCAGGIIGKGLNNTKIVACTNTGVINSGNAVSSGGSYYTFYCAGIAGFLSGENAIEYCKNWGRIFCNRGMGGLVGVISSTGNVTIKSCYSDCYLYYFSSISTAYIFSGDIVALCDGVLNIQDCVSKTAYGSSLANSNAIAYRIGLSNAEAQLNCSHTLVASPAGKEIQTNSGTFTTEDCIYNLNGTKSIVGQTDNFYQNWIFLDGWANPLPSALYWGFVNEKTEENLNAWLNS